MSRPFSFLIDERKLRLQLRSLKAPVNEEAWKKFENYISSLPEEELKTGIRKIEFSINRKVAVPVAFALFIGLSAMMLVNLVSFEKPSDVSVKEMTPPEVVSEISAEALEGTSALQNLSEKGNEKQTMTESVKPETAPKPEHPNNAVKSTGIVAAKVIPNSTGATQAEDSQTISSVVNTVIPQTLAPSRPDSVATNISGSVDKEKEIQNAGKKRRKKNTEQQLSEIRPTLVPDEGETDVVPN